MLDLGTSTIDLAKLVVTRLLIQASSGGGKSWALRRLIEQAFGKIQIIVIDPEGEFATLREKFDFVLASKGGDTPADARSAAMLAQRLLELQASAVCDLYEMNPLDRHRWVALFLDSLVNAPKELWHPVLVIVDEAHVFCPEKGKGDSEARSAVLSLISRGRKRGFCSVLATQRLAKLDKDAAAELLNVMVGRTILDVDRDRAAEALGIRRADKEEFHTTVRTLTPGQFFILGPAFPEAVGADLMTVGKIQTTHPESGSAKAAHKPPTPQKIKSLLPRLEDLPKEAEQKAKTEAELRAEIRELKKSTIGTKAATDPKAIDAAVQQAVQAERRQWQLANQSLRQDLMRLLAGISGIAKQAAKLAEQQVPEVKNNTPVLHSTTVISNHGFQKTEVKLVNKPSDNGELTGPERKILTAMAQLLSIGKESAPKNMVAAWAGYSPQGGAFGNPAGALRSKGYVDYPFPGTMMLTEAGKSVVGSCDPPDSAEVRRRIEATCTGPERKILGALLDTGGNEISKEELAEKSGYSPVGGAFGNPVGALRTKGLLYYPRPGIVKASDWLMEYS